MKANGQIDGQTHEQKKRNKSHPVERFTVRSISHDRLATTECEGRVQANTSISSYCRLVKRASVFRDEIEYCELFFGGGVYCTCSAGRICSAGNLPMWQAYVASL